MSDHIIKIKGREVIVCFFDHTNKIGLGVTLKNGKRHAVQATFSQEDADFLNDFFHGRLDHE